MLEEAARPWNWYQDDPTHATVKQVIGELTQARTVLEKGPAMYIGEIREFATADPPEGWLRCNGALVADVDYPLLGAVIHAGYREDSDHFLLPDRTVRYGMDGVYPGMQGGEQSHTMTTDELVPHSHTESAAIELPNAAGAVPIATAQAVPGVTGSAGLGVPFNVLNPYEGTQFYIRAAWPTAG